GSLESRHVPAPAVLPARREAGCGAHPQPRWSVGGRLVRDEGGRSTARPHPSRPLADLCPCRAHDTAAARVRAAVRPLRRARPLDTRASLDIAGAGVMSDACRAAAARDPRIRFHGFVTGPAKDRLLGSADVLLFPSLCWEVVGLVMLEAFAHGVPVIASRTGGIPEFVDEGRTGMLVEP